MNPVITAVLDTAGASVLVATIVQVSKFLLSYPFGRSPNLMNWTRMYVYAVSIAVVLVNLMVATKTGLSNGADDFSAVAFALSVGTGAIVTYHLLTGSPFSVTPATPDTTPVPAPVASPVVPPADAAPAA